MTRAISGALSVSIYVLTSAMGAVAFLEPFWRGVTPSANAYFERAHEAPLLLTVLVGLCFAALLVEVQGKTLNAKVVATLGVLSAVISVLRFAEVALPGPGGFSPMFAPILLAGYVFGARFGFMLGAFTLLVSGLVTGGVGPWLPYQMFTAGWVGLSAGWIGNLARQRQGPLAVTLLALVGFLWGLVYGAIMNVYFWPYVMGPIDQSWQAGAGLGQTLSHYGTFYLATSLWWDAMRGVGNALLVLVLGTPTLRALSRFRDRFQFKQVVTPVWDEQRGKA